MTSFLRDMIEYFDSLGPDDGPTEEEINLGETWFYIRRPQDSGYHWEAKPEGRITARALIKQHKVMRLQVVYGCTHVEDILSSLRLRPKYINIEWMENVPENKDW